MYVDSSFFCGLVPSISAIDDKKQNKLQLAKTPWSRPTRARISRFGRPGKTTLRWRKPNQVVAAGPKMPGEWSTLGSYSDLVQDKHTTSVERHTSCSCKVMLLQSATLNSLLRHHVASRKKDLFMILVKTSEPVRFRLLMY